MAFELLEHPADIGFRAHADIPAALFVECARALISLIFDASNVEPRQQLELSADGGDRESLLVNWLNEVLFFTDSRRFAIGSFGNPEIGPDAIRCTVYGEPRDPVKHPAKLVVKAVTYHQLRIVQTATEWVADVYVDV